jgi:hypothetical protein
MDKYKYLTNCVEADGDEISVMYDIAEDLTYDEFLEKVPWSYLGTIKPFDFYEAPNKNEGGLKLKDDWHVSYHASLFQGKPCIFIQHSCIEYIFVRS